MTTRREYFQFSIDYARSNANMDKRWMQIGVGALVVGQLFAFNVFPVAKHERQLAIGEAISVIGAATSGANFREYIAARRRLRSLQERMSEMSDEELDVDDEED